MESAEGSPAKEGEETYVIYDNGVWLSHEEESHTTRKPYIAHVLTGEKSILRHKLGFKAEGSYIEETVGVGGAGNAKRRVIKGRAGDTRVQECHGKSIILHNILR